MNVFDRANEALRHDLEAYTRALQTIVTALPQAQELCDRVIKETRLARALLAFSTGPQTAELVQLAFHLTNNGLEVTFMSDEWHGSTIDSTLEYLALVEMSIAAELPRVDEEAVMLSLRT